MPDGTSFSATTLMREGFRALVRPPFFWLSGLGILGVIATSPIEQEDAAVLFGIAVVTVISAYSTIGLTLAAAEQEPDRNPETWIRAAVLRRCLLRSFVAGIFAYILVVAGLFALLVPGFIVGAALALADIAAVLENHAPGDALRRSVDLTKPARRPIGIVFGLLVILPGGALQAALYLAEIEPDWLRTAAQCATHLLSSAAHIALTKAFLTLGGRKLDRKMKPTPQRP